MAPVKHVPVTWSVQLLFHGSWITLGKGYPSKNEAEWMIGLWKQQNNCRGDSCFRTVKQEAP